MELPFSVFFFLLLIQILIHLHYTHQSCRGNQDSKMDLTAMRPAVSCNHMALFSLRTKWGCEIEFIFRTSLRFCAKIQCMAHFNRDNLDHNPTCNDLSSRITSDIRTFAPHLVNYTLLRFNQRFADASSFSVLFADYKLMKL